jgi:hypothetical protein
MSACSSTNPPFQLAKMGPSITEVHLVTSQDRAASNVRRALAKVAGRPVSSFTFPLARHTQYLIGSFSLAGDQSARGSQFAFVLIDTQDHQMLTTYAVPNAGLTRGWDSTYNKVAHRFSWLSDIADRKASDGSYVDPGDALVWSGGSPRTFTFYGMVPTDAIPLNGPHPALIAAVFAVGPSGQPWAAQRLPVTAPHLSAQALFFGK